MVWWMSRRENQGRQSHEKKLRLRGKSSISAAFAARYIPGRLDIFFGLKPYLLGSLHLLRVKAIIIAVILIGLDVAYIFFLGSNRQRQRSSQGNKMGCRFAWKSVRQWGRRTVRRYGGDYCCRWYMPLCYCALHYLHNFYQWAEWILNLWFTQRESVLFSGADFNKKYPVNSTAKLISIALIRSFMPKISAET